MDYKVVNPKEYQELREIAQKAKRYEVKTNKRFLRLKTNSLPNLYKLNKGELALFLYLMSNINRDTGYKEKDGEIIYYNVWANLDKYYNNQLLVTARTQRYIQKETGFSQANISRWLTKLKNQDYVREVGTEIVKMKGNDIPVKILALGVIMDIGVDKIETFFYEMNKENKGYVESTYDILSNTQYVEIT